MNYYFQMYLFLTVEIWKEFPMDKRYMVSSFGRVKGLYVEILKQRYLKGYCQINLNGSYGNKSFSVHRMVMMGFYGESKLHVNHINGIKTCNYLWNLEYCTSKENKKHAVKNGLHNGRKIGLFIEGELKILFNSSEEAGKYFGYSGSFILRVIKGKQKNSKMGDIRFIV